MVRIDIEDPTFPAHKHPGFLVEDRRAAWPILQGIAMISLQGIRLTVPKGYDIVAFEITKAAVELGLMVDGMSMAPTAITTLDTMHGMLAPDGRLWAGDHNLIMLYLTAQAKLVEEIGYLRLRQGRWDVVPFRQSGGELTDRQYTTLCAWHTAHGRTFRGV